MDVEDIAPGQNFAQTIDLVIESCRTMLVVIGPRWQEILLERAARGEEDFVRHEIESALAHQATVIPVLVGGATAAELGGIPSGLLGDLPFRQAVELHDTSFKDDCDRLAKSLGASSFKRWRMPLVAVAIVAIIAVLLSLLFTKYGLGSWRERRLRDSRVAQLLKTAETQSKLAEYEAAYRTCTEAAKLSPSSRAALDAQVDADMLWLENYSVLTSEGQNAGDVAAPQLAELMVVLDGGLSRSNGNEPRSAKILAHIGWAHWLNQHIAEKEFGSAAEQAFRRALSIEPTNVYANAMLGNWLLQNNGSLAEAVQCFSAALATGEERPLVRRMQLGGMVYNDATGVPAESFKALNDMRKHGEPLDEAYKRRFLSFDLDPSYSGGLLKPVLSAVPAEEAWQTYLWLDDAPDHGREEADFRQLKREFVQATLLELQGKKDEAVNAFRILHGKVTARHLTGSFADRVATELSH